MQNKSYRPFKQHVYEAPNFSTLPAGCQYYQPEGRRGGVCSSLGASSSWKACALAVQPCTSLGRSARNDHEAGLTQCCQMSDPAALIFPLNSALEGIRGRRGRGAEGEQRKGNLFLPSAQRGSSRSGIGAPIPKVLSGGNHI